MPSADVDRSLTFSNPADYLPRTVHPVFNLLAQAFDVRLYAADGVTPLQDFNPPLGFELIYLDHDIEPGWNEGYLQVYAYAGGTWNSLPTAVDKTANTLTASIAHLASSYGVFDARFVLSLPLVSR